MVRDRPYMRRTAEENRQAEEFESNNNPGGTQEGEIPLWEEITDALRRRLWQMIHTVPISCVQEYAMLVDAVNGVQVIHLRGQDLDKKDPQEGDDDDDSPGGSGSIPFNRRAA